VTRVNRGTFAGIAVALTFLFHYYNLLLNPSIPDRVLITHYHKIAAGVELAPDQYRFFIPKLAAFVTHITSLPLEFVAISIDGCSLIGGILLLANLLQRLGLGEQIFSVLMYITALATTVLLYPRAESLPAFLGATSLLTAYAEPRRLSVLIGGSGAVLLAGCRPEMVTGAAIPFMFRWWSERRIRDLASAIALVALGCAGVLIPIHLYPKTKYMTDVIQVEHNLNPANFVVPLLISAPVLLSLSLPTLRKWAPLLSWVGSVVALTFVVGRLDEARIFFPLSGVLGFTGAHLWVRPKSVDLNSSVATTSPRTNIQP
jgi:hypothetical protein